MILNALLPAEQKYEKCYIRASFGFFLPFLLPTCFERQKLATFTQFVDEFVTYGLFSFRFKDITLLHLHQEAGACFPFALNFPKHILSKCFLCLF